MHGTNIWKARSRQIAVAVPKWTELTRALSSGRDRKWVSTGRRVGAEQDDPPQPGGRYSEGRARLSGTTAIDVRLIRERSVVVTANHFDA